MSKQHVGYSIIKAYVCDAAQRGCYDHGLCKFTTTLTPTLRLIVFVNRDMLYAGKYVLIVIFGVLCSKTDAKSTKLEQLTRHCILKKIPKAMQPRGLRKPQLKPHSESDTLRSLNTPHYAIIRIPQVTRCYSGSSNPRIHCDTSRLSIVSEERECIQSNKHVASLSDNTSRTACCRGWTNIDPATRQPVYSPRN